MKTKHAETLTQDQFVVKCLSYAERRGDYFTESEDFVYFRNGFGCILATYDKRKQTCDL